MERRESTRTTLSRREVLATAGVAATGFAAADVAAETGATVTVARDRSLAPVSDALAGAVERAGVDLSTVAVDTADGFERVLGGDVDVLHATRPMLPSEAAAAEDAGVDYRAYESAVDGVALLRPTGEWRSPLSADRLTDLRSSTPRTQTWAELVPPTGAVGDPPVGTAAPASRPDDDATVAVRGVRSTQYAVGRGGLGYYEVAGGDLTAPETVGDDPRASLVGRLRYTYVDDDALGRAGVGAFLRRFAARARRTAAGAVPFRDASGRFEALDARQTPA